MGLQGAFSVHLRICSADALRGSIHAVPRVLQSGDPNGIDFGQGPAPFGQSQRREEGGMRRRFDLPPEAAIRGEAPYSAARWQVPVRVPPSSLAVFIGCGAAGLLPGAIRPPRVVDEENPLAIGRRRISSMPWCRISMGPPCGSVPVIRHWDRHSAKSPDTVVW